MTDRKSQEKVVKLHGRNCPNCGKPEAEPYRPFCSKRCADVDLGRWLKEDYRIATDEFPGFDDAPEDER